MLWKILSLFLFKKNAKAYFGEDAKSEEDNLLLEILGM